MPAPDDTLHQIWHSLGQLQSSVDHLIEQRQGTVQKLEHLHNCLHEVKSQLDPIVEEVGRLATKEQDRTTAEHKGKAYRTGLMAGLITAAGAAGASAKEGLEMLAKLVFGGQ